ncbi:MAG: hypothetical protein KatS3mg114_0468 [Planctomycetaceae bacterium]|nr:MAG: hypothetical protein KatS3mg114_0468 [Planctomycetaceae bacterium]
MNESRERSLASLLARGLSRVRQRAGRTGLGREWSGTPQTHEADRQEADAPAEMTDTPNHQGDQR